MKKFFFLLLIIAAIIGISSCNSNVQNKAQPNIIIVFADDLGYGDLSCYGHPTIKTVNIDKMAEEGIRFTSFYAAASVCTPSRAALLTGRYPIRHAWYNFGPESTNGLPENEITLADLLKNKGYKTMAIGKWHLGHQTKYLPTSRGFDSFYGLPYSNDMLLPWCPWLNEKDKLFLYEDTIPVKEIGYDQEELTENYTKKAIEFIRDNKDKPFFLYLAHSMPHLPISTSKKFIGQSKAGLYGDVIETIDWSMGEIYTTLKELGVDENTLVVFTSDNGPWQNLPERMLQKGVEPWHSGSAGMLKGAKMTTYEGGFRVPAIIRWPGKIQNKMVADQVVTTMDLFTTLASIVGAEPPKDRVIDGENVISVLNGKNNNKERTFFYLNGKKLQAIRKGKWKLRATKSIGYELYDLDTDPGERYNLATKRSQIVNELYEKLVNFSAKTNAKLETVEK